MIEDIVTVAWKEWREQLHIGGGRRGTVLRAFFSIGLLGVLWPWLIGSAFITTSIPIVFAIATSAMYVAAIVPDSFAGERERRTLETLLASRLPDSALLLGKVAACWSYGWLASIAMLAVGVLTVNITHPDQAPLFFPATTLASALALSALAGAVMAGIGVLVSLRSATVKQATQTLATGLTLLLLLPAILAQVAPEPWDTFVTWMGSTESPLQLLSRLGLTLSLAALLLIAIAIRRFSRTHLMDG